MPAGMPNPFLLRQYNQLRSSLIRLEQLAGA